MDHASKVYPPLFCLVCVVCLGEGGALFASKGSGVWRRLDLVATQSGLAAVDGESVSGDLCRELCLRRAGASF